jgi:subtilisin family serine protease
VPKLDPLLAIQLDPGPTDTSGGPDPNRRVRVSVELRGDPEALEKAGLVVERVSRSFVTGSITLRELPALAALEEIDSVRAPRKMREQLDHSVPETRANEVRTHSPPFTGSGVIVGVVDSGIDIFHDNFLTPGGDTRILRIWDQFAPQRIEVDTTATDGTFTLDFTPPGGRQVTTAAIAFDAGPNDVRHALENLSSIDPGDALVTGGPLGTAPVTVAFAGRYLKQDVERMDVTDNVVGGNVTVTAGREYSPDDIRAALAAPEAPFLHRDNSGHGTHVAGIAAGDGSQADGCKGAGTYIGVAPEAELLIVKTTRDDEDLPAAVEWIFDQAGARRCVVNVSIGFQVGPHDGTTAQERRIDATLNGMTNRAVVVSAGNERSKGIHAFDRINPQGTLTWRFVVPRGDRRRDEIDIWYTGATRVRFTLTGPPNVPGVAGPVDPGDPALDTVLGGNRVHVESILNEPFSGRHNINVLLRPPAGGQVSPGTWTIDLRELANTAGDVDAWIDFQRPDKFPAFFEDEFGSDRDTTRMIGPPAGARHVITVGSYDPRPDGQVYSLAGSSCFGPTTDVPARRKPEICAPGIGIMSAKSRARDVSACSDCCIDFYVPKDGTSMAAPHVTGVVALLMQRAPGLTTAQIRDRIMQSGRDPEPNPVPALPNNQWGHGRVDAMEAVFPELPVADGGGGGGGGGGMMLAPAAMVLAEPSLRARIARLQRAAGTGAQSQLVAALVSTHFDEVLRLINDNLRVAVTWHRMGGPDLVRALLTAERPMAALAADPDAAARFLETLDRYGGPALRADIAHYGPLVLAPLTDPERRAPAA